MNYDPVDEVEKVQTREDFVRFVLVLMKDLANNHEEWENKDLLDYLTAIASWTEDMDGYFHNRGEPIPEVPDWKLFAKILLAASIYE